MKTLLSSLLIAASLAGVSVASQAMENCPKVSSVQQKVPGLYSAAGQDGDWNSTFQDGLTGTVSSFVSATAVQEEEGKPQKLESCTYNLSPKGEVSLRFSVKNNESPAIKTEGADWKKEAGGYMLYYDCKAADPETCKFSLVQ